MRWSPFVIDAQIISENSVWKVKRGSDQLFWPVVRIWSRLGGISWLEKSIGWVYRLCKLLGTMDDEKVVERRMKRGVQELWKEVNLILSSSIWTLAKLTDVFTLTNIVRSRPQILSCFFELVLVLSKLSRLVRPRTAGSGCTGFKLHTQLHCPPAGRSLTLNSNLCTATYRRRSESFSSTDYIIHCLLRNCITLLLLVFFTEPWLTESCREISSFPHFRAQGRAPQFPSKSSF